MITLPPHKVCEQICALHVLLATSNSHLDNLLKLLAEHKLAAGDLPEFFYCVYRNAPVQLPPDHICKRIFQLHAQIAATKPEWTTARKKLLRLLEREKLAWGFLSKILAAEWLKRNPQAANAAGQTASPSAAPTASAAPSVDVFELNCAVIEDRMVTSNAACVVLALWALNTYTFRTFEYAPQVGVISPASGCGKTTLLKVLKGIVANPWYSSHATAPGIYRRLWRQPQTCLLDEAENQGLLQDKKLRALLDAMFERDGSFEIVIDGESEQISVYAPTVWAIRGETRDVPLSLLSRALIVSLKKGTPRKRFFSKDPELADVYAENKKFAASVKAGNVQLALDPPLPEELDPRLADLYRPLLAIADSLGHGAEARDALVEICGARSHQDVGIQLLLDIKTIKTEQQDEASKSNRIAPDRIALKDLAKAVVELAPERWADWRGPSDHGAPHTLTPGEVSRLLRRFSIFSHTVWPVPRLPDSKSFVGYRWSDFERAWADYCDDSHTSTQSGKIISFAAHAKHTSSNTTEGEVK